MSDDNLKKLEFEELAKEVSRKYNISKGHADCYIANGGRDTYLCRIYNGGCKDLAKCEEIYTDGEHSIYPLKCECGCKGVIRYDVFCENQYGIFEYKLKCKACNTYLGTWDRGEWIYE